MDRSLTRRVAAIFLGTAIFAGAVQAANDWTQGVGYTYDGSGNIRQIGTDAYVYDAVGRLVQADTNGIRRMYTYDAFGNRQSCAQPGTDCQYGRTVDPAKNQIVGGHYDAAGNLDDFDSHLYSYDAFNMQTRDLFGGVAREYVYTAGDERIAVYVPNSGTWRWSMRDASGKVLRELTSRNPTNGTLGTASWTWVRDYVYRDGLLLASRQLEADGTVSTYRYHLDHLGTPRRVTDTTNHVIGEHSYHAFGPESSEGRVDEPVQTALKYTGHERDPDLDYMHARYYDSDMGRFLSVDPGGFYPERPQSWNRYAYVENNPLRSIDPDGRDVVYADDYSRAALTSARTVSPGTDAVIANFECDPNKSVTFLVGDAPDPTGSTRLAQTMTRKDGDLDQRPTEFRVVLDKADIERKGADTDAVVIHEVVGHLGPNSERTARQNNKMGDAGREKDAQKRTVKEIQRIDPKNRPTLPQGHLQPPPPRGTRKPEDDERK